ncbi:MAG TPA: hypothetical protein VL687_01050 [Methylomirabilota bacterium]|nr:hypothetical protein [Methylomirabilota bacterium]
MGMRPEYTEGRGASTLDTIVWRADAQATLHRVIQMRGIRLAVMLVANLAAGCQALPSPAVPTRAMTVTIPIPAAGRDSVDAADKVFARRLKALGITKALVATEDDSLRYSMQVPIAVDDEVVDAILHRSGVIELVPWPAGEGEPAVGDPVPATATALIGAAEIRSGEVSTDSSGQPSLLIKLSAAGSEALATFTTEHIGEYLLVVLDGHVLAPPIVNTPITGGDLIITFPTAEPPPISLTAIAAMLVSGPLPEGWR